MGTFQFQPSRFIPFRDQEVIERVRNIKREDIEKREPHHHPEFKIRVVKDDMISHIFVTDMFYRIMKSDQEDKPVVLICPNPNHGYRLVAHLINRFRVNCRNVHIFNMDEFADDAGNTAPESWPQGFMHAMKKYFYYEIDRELRMPEEQIQGPTSTNISYYGKMISDLGGADACYSGPGWTGHIAFIDPDTDAFKASSLEEWKALGPRILELNPFTVAQNSLHGCFGFSGDMAAVPPYAATIGPAQVIEAKYRMDTNALTTCGTKVSWQRFTTRLACHGPVTPQVPTSLLQSLPADFYISEASAMTIEPDWDMGY
ncbi:MAG TPA: hypothetical protein PLG43_05240 [Spirochaetia bacterium]|nr:hypothetical protein [Spirochaetia bacterium]